MELWVGLGIGSALLVSLTWWETYFTLFNNKFLDDLAEDMKKSRWDTQGLLHFYAAFIILSSQTVCQKNTVFKTF